MATLIPTAQNMTVVNTSIALVIFVSPCKEKFAMYLDSELDLVPDGTLNWLLDACIAHDVSVKSVPYSALSTDVPKWIGYQPSQPALMEQLGIQQKTGKTVRIVDGTERVKSAPKAATKSATKATKSATESAKQTRLVSNGVTFALNGLDPAKDAQKIRDCVGLTVDALTEQFMGIKMPLVRQIGYQFGAKGRSKREIAERILTPKTVAVKSMNKKGADLDIDALSLDDVKRLYRLIAAQLQVRNVPLEINPGCDQ